MSPEDITLQKGKDIVPENLKDFLSWLLGEEEQKEIKVLSMAQDIIHILSNGKKAMPKNIGLAIAVKSLVRSKELNEVLHKNGHCVSYDTVRLIETCWAENILRSGDGYATIPSNIKYGDFVQAASDNGDYSQENSTQHVTNTVLYQYPLVPGSFIREEVLRKPVRGQRRKTLSSFESKLLLQLPSTQKCYPSTYYSVIQLHQLKPDEKNEIRKTCNAVNMMWILCRNLPTKLFGVELCLQQNIPPWSGFHSLLSVKVSSPTTIGNCRSIPAPPTDIQVVYNMLANVERMLHNLGQMEHAYHG